MCGSKRFEILGERLNRRQGTNPRTAIGLGTGVKRCLDCRLVYTDPRPVPASLDDHYDVDPAEYWSKESLAPPGPEVFRSQIATARRLLGEPERMKALDVGAGTGVAMQALQRAGMDAWGLEPSAHFREVAIRRGLPGDRLIHSPIETAEWEENFFDFITLHAVVEHLQEPARAIERTMRWLKPGGVLHAEVPSSDWLMSKLANLFFRMRGTNYVTNTSPLHPPYHLYEFTRRSFEAHAARKGHEVVESQIDVCTVRGLPRPLHGVFRWLMGSTGTGLQLTIWLRRPV
jgi:SAM-dependent methyltransferase